MKLTIEHLAPYLPYDLQFLSGHYLVGIYTGNDNDVTRPLLMSETKRGPICWEAYLDMDIPILRPLSYFANKTLGDYIKEFGCTHKIINEIWDVNINDKSKEDILLETYKFLCIHHFDVFGLIEKGLAIDINEV